MAEILSTHPAVVRLAPGAEVLLREEHALQFGLDATTAGVLPAESAAAVVAALRPTHSPIELAAVQDRLRAAGLDAATATAVLSDLLFHRVLIDAHPTSRSIVLLGRSPLAHAIAELCRHEDIRVRHPLSGESDSNFLRASGSIAIPVVIADRLAQANVLAGTLAGHADTVVPVTLLGPQGLIGPLRIGGIGPCLLCACLHGTDADPLWFRLLRQLPSGPSRPSVLSLTGTALATLGLIHQLLGTPPAPGAPPPDPKPGWLLQVDSYGRPSNPQSWAAHPRCPVCFNDTAPKPPAGSRHSAPL